jgi:hypothetical protein
MNQRLRRFLPLLWVVPLIAVVFFDRGLPGQVETRRGIAELDVEIEADGGASSRIEFRERPAPEFLAIGKAVMVAAFPDRNSSVRVDPNGARNSFIRAHTPDVYVPGPHPVVTINAGAVRRVFLRYGMPRMSVWVCPAGVDTTISPPRFASSYGDCKRPDWHGLVTAEMRPRPVRLWRGVAMVAGMLATIAIGLVALHKRRSHLAIGVALAGFVLPLFITLVGWSVSNDEAKVAGRSMSVGEAANGWGDEAAMFGNAAVLGLALRRNQKERPRRAPFPPPA